MLKNAFKIKLRKQENLEKSKGEPHLIFELNKKFFAVPLSTVHRFEERGNILKIPSSIDFFLGVVTYLDEFVGVLNLKKAARPPNFGQI
ncbi:MAG: hypothetical protein HRU09_20105 [Oligoflexales bacterium]|nr:hypothetical protein [Oligoflexales bacterium]